MERTGPFFFAITSRTGKGLISVTDTLRDEIPDDIGEAADSDKAGTTTGSGCSASSATAGGGRLASAVLVVGISCDVAGSHDEAGTTTGSGCSASHVVAATELCELI